MSSQGFTSQDAKVDQVDGPAWHPTLPARLGRYRILKKLGGGGMGVVLLARDDQLDRDVAIKVVRPDQALLDEPHPRFQREIDAVARLHHHGIAPIHDAGFDAGLSWYAMEWIPGCTLSELVKELGASDPRTLTGLDAHRAVAQLSATKHPPVVPQAEPNELFDGTWATFAFRVTERIAGTLDHAHAQGTLHRDVKPSNVMITPDGRVFLIDFGLAIHEEQETITHTGVAVGSLPYMAPEQLQGLTSALDGRTDIYALGVTLYELATLRQPFRSSNDEATRRRIIHQDIPRARVLNPDLSWDQETVISVAMDPVPSRRYRSTAAMASDLANVCAGRAVNARRAAAHVRLSRWIRMHPTATTGVGLGLMTIAALTWGLVRAKADADRISRALTAADSARVAADSSRLQMTELISSEFEFLNSGDTDGRIVDLEGIYESRRRRLASLELSPAETAFYRYNLARIANRLSRHRDARDDDATALAIYRELFDGDHEMIATSLDKLANDYQFLDDIDAAEALCEESLAMRARMHGEDSLPYARSLSTRAGIQRRRGDIDQAHRTYQSVLKVYERELEAASSSRHPLSDALLMSLRESAGEIHHGLGITLLRSSDPRGAREHFEAALAHFARSRGVPVDQASCQYHLAICARVTGELDAAREHLEQAAEIQQRYLGPDDILAHQICSERGHVEWAAGRREDSVTFLMDAVDGFSRSEIEDRSKAPATRVVLASYLMKMNRDADAIAQLEAVETEAAAVNDPLIAGSVQWALADIAEKLGRAEEAIPRRRTYIKAHEQSLGRDHARVITLRLVQCRTLARSGATQDSRRCLEGILEWLADREGAQARLVTRSLGPLYLADLFEALIEADDSEGAIKLAVEVATQRFRVEQPNPDERLAYLSRLTDIFTEMGEALIAREIRKRMQ